MRKLILIAAIGKKMELGYQNNLIWHLKKDLANFKTLTTGHYILMGKNTYDSLPKKLSNRKYLILSSSMMTSDDYMVFHNLDEFIDFYNTIEEEVYVIGGSQIYNTLLEYCDELILTEIEDSYKKADVYFPYFNKANYDKVILNSYQEEEIQYNIVKYIKKNSQLY